MASFQLGQPPAPRARSGSSPSSPQKPQKTTRRAKPRRWAPNELTPVKMECGHWQQPWPEIRAFPRGFVKVYCDICGDWRSYDLKDPQGKLSNDDDALF